MKQMDLKRKLLLFSVAVYILLMIASWCLPHHLALGVAWTIDAVIVLTLAFLCCFEGSEL